MLVMVVVAMKIKTTAITMKTTATSTTSTSTTSTLFMQIHMKLALLYITDYNETHAVYHMTTPAVIAMRALISEDFHTRLRHINR